MLMPYLLDSYWPVTLDTLMTFLGIGSSIPAMMIVKERSDFTRAGRRCKLKTYG